MKLLVFVVWYVVCSFAEPLPPALPTPSQDPEPIHLIHKVSLLGTKECTYGPTYWCKNITTAAGCRAVKHCIQTVWEHQKLPPDHTSVCETCLEMVKEARDQLLSNETQEEIKEVFDGSCKLIPVKVVAEACMKVADEFIVELVDALASQMNPQVVCSIAGLCNNERVHELLDEMTTSASSLVDVEIRPDTCKGCHTVVGLVEKRFHRMSRDQILESFLLVCRRMGSLSDSCSNIVIKYFNDIYSHLEENLNPDEFCLMSGECSAMFHTHVTGIEITPLSNVGVVRVGEQDDLPCDLCKQLVEHLRDILVANTTESEFKRVLLGICKQTKSFKDECTSLVNEYYPLIYNFLVNDLNGTVICAMVGICERPGMQLSHEVPIIPLLHVETVQNPLLSIRPGSRVGSVQIIQQPKLMQLPIERVMPQTLTLLGNTELCTFCEYFLHFVQQAITDPKTEDSIKKIVDDACDLLPRSVNQTCRQFVDTYGPAFIAILAQEIDPSVVCPKLSLCPSAEAQNVEVFMHRVKGDKPNCPMCLLAMESLEELIKSNKTEASITQALANLCSHLHGTVQAECKNFVQRYAPQIIEAFLAHLTPAEVCQYLRLCKDTTPAPPLPQIHYGGSIDTNEIPDSTAYGKLKPTTQHSPLCVLCEFILSQIDKQLSDNATEEEIKEAVLNVCNYLPKSVRGECTNFINNYADFIINLLIQNLDPSSVCTNLKFCMGTKKVEAMFTVELLEPVQENVASPQCVLCKMVISKIEQLLNGSISEDAILTAVHNVCKFLPTEQSKECNDFINKYGRDIIKLLEMAIQPSEMCSLMMLCSAELENTKYEGHSCGVCEAAVLIMDQILQNPNVDHTLEHVLEKTCRALSTDQQPLCRGIIELYGEKLFKMLAEAAKPSTVCTKVGLCAREQLVGTNKCTWGPGYWCIDEGTAIKCGMKSHCQQYVWMNQRPIK